MMARIDVLQQDDAMSMIVKEAEKAKAETEYRALLEEQRKQRLKAAEGKTSGRG
jgi:hypothetical protein